MKNILIDINKILNNKILIWGYGLEGKSILKLLLEKGAKNIYIATKDKINENSAFFIQECDILKYDFDIVIKSPGVSYYKKECKILLERKTLITSSLNILLSKIILNNKKVKTIGITGTKGKSTSCKILYHILSNMNYKVALVGNIGVSFLDIIDNLDDYDYIILELSSCQIKTLNCDLDYSIILNLFPEHIDWHLTHENYFKDKLNITNYSRTIIFNGSDDIIKKYINNDNNTRFIDFTNDNFSIENNYLMYENKKILDTNLIENIKGEHIFKNIFSILAFLQEEGININKAVNTLITFKTLKHRLDIFYNDKQKNTIFVNDSISTIPESTIEAIKAFNKNNLFLILGGFDRQQDYSSLIKFVVDKSNNIKKVFLIGQTGRRMIDLLKDKIDFEIYGDYDSLVKSIKSNNLTNTTVLLSPASASYDMFKNFEQRGDVFEQLMLKK